MPNYFIDNYIKDANEAQVKIYLYLLRNLPGGSFSIGSAADDLNFSERDISRALDYWHRMGLLSLQYNNGSLCAISLIDPVNTPAASPSPLSTVATSIAPAFRADIATVSPMQSSPGIGYDTVKVPAEPQIHAEEKAHKAAPRVESVVSSPTQFYTKDQINDFTSQDDIQEIIFITKGYFGRPLTLPETNTILYMYDTLKLPANLIEYLVEYCADNGHSSMHYIKSVATAWYEDGVLTVEQAKERTSSFNTGDVASLKKAFGIKGRDLGSEELKYFKYWKNDLGFGMDIILLAADRTLINTGSASFKYANTMLSNWKKENIRTPDDVTRSDEARKASIGPAVSKQNTKQDPPDKFKNFNERDYDFNALEKKFVKNQ
ncbi:MAG: DnaD domain protein [Lachnospiraceae bacterium]|nr:DnaD domain protein [Lachnospiraceae bacterium]